MAKVIKEVQQHYSANVMIRTKQMPVGIPSLWSRHDVAHIWINGELFRITDKGSLIKADVPIPSYKKDLTVISDEGDCTECLQLDEEGFCSNEFCLDFNCWESKDTKLKTIWVSNNKTAEFVDLLSKETILGIKLIKKADDGDMLFEVKYMEEKTLELDKERVCPNCDHEYFGGLTCPECTAEYIGDLKFVPK